MTYNNAIYFIIWSKFLDNKENLLSICPLTFLNLLLIFVKNPNEIFG